MRLNTFSSARLKLTAWYLLIIMFVSISFSIFLYRELTREFDRLEDYEQYHIQHPEDDITIGPNGVVYQFVPRISLATIEDSKARIAAILALTNVVILTASGFAGYFLAGKTLKPIQEMVDEQDRFIADASHELRTPLTALKSEIEVNLRDKNLSLDQAKTLLKSNLEEVDNLQVLSNNLLVLAEHDKRQRTTVFQPVLLSQVLEDAVKRVALLVKRKKIEIVVSAGREKLFVKGIESQLVELVVVLLENAVKYSDPGSSVQLKLTKVDHSAEIRVVDTGMGIEKNDLPRIFDRFYRADKSRSREDTGGYGLGLAIAKHIVAEHEGTISVESKVQKGTTFTIKLPLLVV